MTRGRVPCLGWNWEIVGKAIQGGCRDLHKGGGLNPLEKGSLGASPTKGLWGKLSKGGKEKPALHARNLKKKEGGTFAKKVDTIYKKR